MAHAIEAHAEPVTPTTAALAPVPVEATTALITPAAPTDVIEQAFHAYQELCDRLLVDDDYQRIGSKKFRKRTGWRKLAVAYGVSVELRSKDYERDDRNRIIRAEVEARAIAPNGRLMDGLGACDVTERCCEPEWCTNAQRNHEHCPPNCNGFRHFSKPGHDIPATAHTRAVSRACSDLFGLGEVSAEEMSERDIHHEERRASAPPADHEEIPVPEGFAGHPEAMEAHKAVNAAIRELDPSIPRAGFRAYKEAHGWPMSRAKLTELHDMVDRAKETFAKLNAPDGDGRPFTDDAETPPGSPQTASEPVDDDSPDADADVCAACDADGRTVPATHEVEGTPLCEPCHDLEVADAGID